MKIHLTETESVCRLRNLDASSILTKNHNDPIERYDEFCERVKALQYEERLSKQDAAGTLPELTGEVKAVGTAVAERA